jgi:hypothetical protein
VKSNCWHQMKIMICLRLLVLYTAATLANAANTKRQTVNTTLLPGRGGDPGVYPGTYDGAARGWPFMPDITTLANATLDTTTLLVGDQGDILTHYVTSNYNAAIIKRAVILVHGEDRPSWNMQIYGNLAMQRAATGGDVKEDEVVILSP